MSAGACPRRQADARRPLPGRRAGTPHRDAAGRRLSGHGRREAGARTVRPDVAARRRAPDAVDRGGCQDVGWRKPAAVSTFWPSADLTSSMNALAVVALGASLSRAIG